MKIVLTRREYDFLKEIAVKYLTYNDVYAKGLLPEVERFKEIGLISTTATGQYDVNPRLYKWVEMER